jgi:hypothetical protein
MGKMALCPSKLFVGHEPPVEAEDPDKHFLDAHCLSFLLEYHALNQVKIVKALL